MKLEKIEEKLVNMGMTVRVNDTPVEHINANIEALTLNSQQLTELSRAIKGREATFSRTGSKIRLIIK